MTALDRPPAAEHAAATAARAPFVSVLVLNWNGARILPNSLSGTRPSKTSDSVPRLIAL